ncbi:hypothetical protein BDV59DRAFT_19132 [Aspergillus ambiguus]|uniref:nonribosomal peptide synthase Pes1 n=1 Tax=Aspergillus ambiguus TaxID=176160 RepID=UPI003CCCC4FF
MARQASCCLPRFSPSSIDSPRRPVSMRTKTNPSETLQLLSSWKQGHLNSLLQTAWALLLYRYTGSEDVCFGYQNLDGEGSCGTEALDSAKPSTFHLTVREQESIQHILRTVEHTGYRTDNSARGAWLEGSPTDYRLFNTTLMVRVCSGLTRNARDSLVQPALLITLPEECRVRLHVKIMEQDVGMFVEWWNNDLSTEQAKSIADFFEKTLHRLLSNEDIVVSDLNVLSELDWCRIRKFNSVPPESPDRCIHDVIYEQTLLRPGREAVCAWDGSLTYQELDSLASQVAAYLQMHGVRPESKVALCFDKSKWYIVAVLGVLKAGGAFVPLDPTHPTSRLQSLVRSVDARIMFCSRNRVDKLGDIAEHLVPLDDDTIAEFAHILGDPMPPPEVQGCNAAYVIFTSGSTGEPKGTLMEHKSYVASSVAHAPRLRIDSESRLLQFAAHTFDASLVDILTVLMIGACICIPSEEERLNDIVKAINNTRVNHASLTPSFIDFINISDVPGLETLVLVGEAMSQSHIETWSKINLLNGFGPTECAVTAAINSSVTIGTDSRNIGLPTGARCWIVDPQDHNRLVPVGCAGEMLLEGPTLARCYLNNPEKTAESFIYDPTWTKDDESRAPRRRFYKTGDLVRYNSEIGSLTYLGRKDTQIKVHGQRVELGEIEDSLNADSNIKHCLVILPKTGFAEGRLVAVISLAAHINDDTDAEPVPLKLVEDTRKLSIISDIRDKLSERLPTYMVPSVWLCVETIPTLTSSKLDRKATANWIGNMENDPEIRNLQSKTGLHENPSSFGNAMEDQIATIWSRVLNIPKSHLALDESFLSLGGDSIAAITCMGFCKKQGIGITVQEIVRSKSIRELATRTKEIEQPVVYEEVVQQPFDLSPIQKLHFMARTEGQGHFNQSVLTRLNQLINEGDLRRSIEILIDRHSMLRARLVSSGPKGGFQQIISTDVKSSYRWNIHRSTSTETIEQSVAQSQSSINAFSGPMLAVDLFYEEGQGLILSIVAHHLVVDIVSWRIILEDLEELLLNGHGASLEHCSLPFQTWCGLQNERNEALATEGRASLEDIPAPELAYWGMQNRQITYGDVDCEGFEVDEGNTACLLKDCHQSLQTEPIDIFLATLLHTFGQTFADRNPPVIYNEGHGREVWDQTIDISRTVGWFTTLYPVLVSGLVADDIVETIVHVKDLRRRAVDNGRQEFTQRMSVGDGIHGRAHHCPMEVSFNYVGQHRDLQRQDGLFQLMNQMAGETGRGGGAADFGEDTPRFALFEISAMAAQGKLRFTFSFNRHMAHQNSIRSWISRCHETLKQIGPKLQALTARPTLSTFPMLSLSYEKLESMASTVLPSIGIESFDMIEDIYPCTRMQQGILLSRLRDEAFYAVHNTFEVKIRDGKPDIDRLMNAWQAVVSRHPLLRTVFIEGITDGDLFCQVVLKSFDACPDYVRCLRDDDVVEALDGQTSVDFSGRRPPHRFTICESASGNVFCRIELSHAIMDGSSISTILRDMQLAYDGTSESTQTPMFKNFVQYLWEVPRTPSIEYWRTYLSDSEPCHFPNLSDGEVLSKKFKTIHLGLNFYDKLQEACERNGFTLSTAFSTAWGLTLRSFCASNDVHFCYMASLRDAPVENIEAVVGPVINILTCRMRMSDNLSLKDVMSKLQHDYMEHLPYRHTSLIDIQRDLKLSEMLFNTGLSYRKLPPSDFKASGSIQFVELGSIYDPVEFPVFVNVEASDNSANVDFNYWTTSLSDNQAMSVAKTFVQHLEEIIHCPEKTLGLITGLSDWHTQKIKTWNDSDLEAVGKCAHEILSERVVSHPTKHAVAAWDGDLTYSKLNELSSALAAYLNQIGVGPGSLVPIDLGRTVWRVVSILAVLKLGGVCVPIIGGRLHEVLNEDLCNEVQVALASPSSTHLLEVTIPYVIPIDKSLFDFLPATNGNVLPTPKPKDNAYVVFTSGDGACSRAIILNHQDILTRAKNFTTAIDMDSSTRLFQSSDYTSDMFLQEMFGAWSEGACLCIPANADLENLPSSINDLRSNMVSTVPSLAVHLRPSDVPQVNTMVLYGGITNAKIKERWAENVQLHTFYGTTECSSTYIHVSRSLASTGMASVGSAIGGRSWLVNPHDPESLVPIGCVGELVVEGPLVSNGYWNDDESTKQNFIERPKWAFDLWNPEMQHRRMFKTGDLARYTSDGQLVYMGKKDCQARVHMDWWRKYLADIESCLFPQFQHEETPRCFSSFTATIKNSEEIRIFVQRLGTDVCSLLQVIWGLVLRCYTGSEDVCFGYCLPGRGQLNRSSTIIEAPFRLHLKDDMILEDVVKKSARDLARMSQHRLPLTEICQRLDIDGTLFNTFFRYSDVTENTDRKGVLSTPNGNDQSKGIIGVNVRDLRPSIQVLFTYASDCLSQDNIADISKCFEHILGSCVGSTACRIGDIEFITEHSCEQIRKWNSILPTRPTKCAYEIIQEQVLRRPLEPAICSWDGEFTYADVDLYSTRLAQHLREVGVKAETFVALCFEKSAWAIISQVAVLKAGGAFVSLDASHPEGRLRAMVEDIGALVVLCSPKYNENVSAISATILSVCEATIRALPTLTSVVPPVHARISDPAYAIFTSGTTGKPKATVIENVGLSLLSLSVAQQYGFGPGTRATQFSSYTFDVSILETIVILMNGGCVCVPSEEERMNDLAGAIRRMEANVLSVPPSVANILDPKSVPSLRTVIAAGEKITPSHIERWADRRVINGYGPSEATILATSCTIVDEAGRRLTRNCHSIGTPLNGRAWVVDPHNYHRLLPVGAVGELVLEGCNVARGYLNDEEKTKEAFITSAHWMKHNGVSSVLQCKERMYRTGDLVYYNHDGSLSFISRKDTQIKLNGQRVELGEIEQQCLRFLPPSAKVAVELVTPDVGTVAKCLVAFFTVTAEMYAKGSPACEPSYGILLCMDESIREAVSSLHAGLSESLPLGLIPKLFVPVQRLPISASGKLDRKKLRSSVEHLSKDHLKAYGISTTQTRQIPETEAMGVLRAVWEEVIGLKPGSVGAEDNFFGIGGDSFSAMKLVSAAKSRGVSMKVTDVYANPIFIDMARHCELSKARESNRTVHPFSLLPDSVDCNCVVQEVADQCCVARELISDIYPCSAVQEGLLTLSLKERGAYIAQPVFRLADNVDIERFMAAWQQTVNEMDILRTRIIHTDTINFLQAVLKEDSISWRFFATFDEFEADNFEHSGFAGGPLTGYAIVKKGLSPATHFIWTIHHALYDGWMLPAVFRRVEQIYHRMSADSTILQYKLFVDYLIQKEMPESEEFWKSYLSNMGSVPFPQNKKNSSNSIRVGNTQCKSMKLPNSTDNGGITLPELIRGAWAIVVSAHTGSSDVCFGETIMGRNIDLDGIENLAGPVLTTVPTRIHVDNGISTAQYLQNIHQLTKDMLPHQHAGLQRIRNINSATSLACDFQNLLVIQSDEGKLDENLWVPEGNRNTSDFFTHPLTVECKIAESKLDITVHHDEIVLDSWTTERMIHQFIFVLDQLLARPAGDTRKVGELDVSSQLDKENIEAWNRREPLCLERCVHDMIYEQKLQRPKAPAVCAWDGQLTYDAMFDLASSFAKYLTSRGVGPETIVPFCLDKSLWAVISILGILIAGGGFVPLDPSHPTSRHKEILEEVDAQMILCSPHYQNRYAGIVRSIIPVSKETVKAYGSISKNAKRSATVKPSNIAFAIFTSGSTGRPKGIVIDHKSLASSAMAFGPIVHMDNASRVFQFASLTFDAAVMEVLATLMHGGCICIPSEDERLNDVAGAIRRMNVSWTFLTPSIASILEPSAVPCLKVLVCGGEKLSGEVVTKWAHHVQLVNGYGPTETTIFAVMNDVSANPEPSCIGFGIPCTLTWVVDPENHDRLTPLGAVGELVLEGPALAREYLKSPEKTADAFVSEPAWMKYFQTAQASPRRIYKTGDLVRYNSDGSIECIGRKDHQVKLHGQRLELGEIEHRLYEDHRVRHAVVIMPKTGLLQQRLVTILSLESLTKDKSIISNDSCELVDRDIMNLAYPQLTEIQEGLERQLPIYMVPQTWAVVKTLPMLVSGKLDRKKITGWIENADEMTYDRIMEDYDNIKRGTLEDKKDSDEDSVVDTLRTIFAEVLNVPSHKIDTHRSFVSLGGDSITGMAVISKARKHGLSLTLHSIIQSKSMTELALMSEKKAQIVQTEERLDHQFDLSPIQSVYFKTASEFGRGSHFNQSITVRATRYIPVDVVKGAIEAVVDRHSMFRARFVKSRDGTWGQRILTNCVSSYQLHVHHIANEHEVSFRTAERQQSLDIQNGPVFAVDLFELPDQRQILALVAHHLCVDMVSWRVVLQDLQDFVESRSLSNEKTMSFQNWCELQAVNAKENGPIQLPFDIRQPDLIYWGMSDVRNVYGDVKMETFMIDQEATSFILRDCHHVFRTETVEILLAAVIHSFRHVFADREVPTIYNEGHGREAWDSSIDISRTVGWFTTFNPMHVSGDKDIIDTLKRVKDLRRSISGTSRCYFAQDIFLSRERGGQSSFPIPLEVIFNYLGQLQQLERSDSLFQHFESTNGAEVFGSTSDMGPGTPRFALFEISAIIIKEKLHMCFTYNRHMKHTECIQKWVLECKRILEEDIPVLQNWVPEPTLSDYPLLPITYEGLENFMRNTLPRAGLRTWKDVEDIYPCSPVQEGILLSQLRDPHGYMFHAILEVRHFDGLLKVEANRLRKAWSKIVQRHQILRTLFVDSYCKGGSFDQLVVKELDSEILEFECEERTVFQTLNNIKLANVNAKRLVKLPQQFAICTTTNGRVFVKIELNHAVIDGGSIDILLRDLQLAYDNKIPQGPGPLFREYIKFTQTRDHAKALDHWVRYLSGINPCHLRFLSAATVERQLGSVMMEFDQFPELQLFCEKNSVTLANIALSSWALVLRTFTLSDDVCFGYLAAGRDSPVPDIQNAVGIFINMLCCRVKFEESQNLLDISRTVQEDFLGGLPYQNCSLAQIQHELGRQGQMLFNTALSIQNHSASEIATDSTISFDMQRAHDPTEYPVTVNVETAKGKEGVLIRYWSDAVSESQAKDLADAMAQVFALFVERPHTSMSELSVRGETEGRTVSDINSPRITDLDEDYIRSLVDSRVKEVIYQMVKDGVLAVPPLREKDIPALKMPDHSFPTVIPQGIKSSDSVPTLTDNIREPNSLEKHLWRLWSEALGLSPDTVIRHASFFKLGGDSISAMKMVGAARQEGLMLSVADVFGNPVFEDMLATLCSRSSTPSSTPDMSNESTTEKSLESPPMISRTISPEEVTIVRPIELDEASLQAGICPRIGLFRGGITDVLPVTDFQALSLAATLFKSRWMLNYFFLDGNGPLDTRRMTESFERVVDAFDILRTVFVCFHGQCFQVILRKMQPEIFIHETENSLEEYTASLQQRDRDQVPCQGEQYVQFYIVKQKGTGHHRILIRMSHAQYDGVCLPRIMSAIKMAYEGCTIPPAPSFSNYIRMLPGTITPEHYQHWKKILHGSRMTEIIRRHAPNSFQHIGAYAEQKRTVEIPATALDNVTIATVMQSAWALTLAKLSSQSDVVFGLTTSGRNATLPGIESIVGPCLNIVPVRVKFGEQWTGLDLIRHLQDQQVANMTFESLGFREIIRQCTDWPDSTYFTTTLFHQSLEYEGEMQLDDHTYRMGGVGVVDNFVDLTLLSKQTSTQHLLISLGYSLKGPVQPGYAAKVLDMVCETAQTLLANPSITLPSPTTLRSLPSQVINDVPRQSDEQFLSMNLNTRSISEILVHSDMVNRIWQQVLPNKNPELPRTPFQLTSSFFELGGDVLNMAQVVWLLEQEGLQVHLEDLLEHPTFLGHMAVLALHNAKQEQHVETTSSDPPFSSLPATPPGSTAKSGTWNPLGKAVTLARKLSKWNMASKSRQSLETMGQ